MGTKFDIDFRLTGLQEFESWSLVLTRFSANWLCTKAKSFILVFNPFV